MRAHVLYLANVGMSMLLTSSMLHSRKWTDFHALPQVTVVQARACIKDGVGFESLMVLAARSADEATA